MEICIREVHDSNNNVNVACDRDISITSVLETSISALYIALFVCEKTISFRNLRSNLSEIREYYKQRLQQRGYSLDSYRGS